MTLMATNDPAVGRIAWDGTRTPLKTALFLVVCVTWLLPGLVGHDPWKYDEAVVFGAGHEILRTGDWIHLRIAGEPFFGKAPLFVWTAALLAKLLGASLPARCGRLSAGVFVAARSCSCRARHGAPGRARHTRSGPLLIGCLGLLIRAHEMTSDLASLAASAMALWGLALAHRRPYAGGAIAGAAIGIGFLGDGFLPAG
jgi:4-amino-4-deoxy-L-arabinose transferase-like glycosyltransferase